MSAYTPRSFALHELVPPDMFAARGERLWELLDPRALATLQSLRDALGVVVVNNWRAGGAYAESGLRSMNSRAGATFSQHKYGRAFDCKIHGVTPQEAHDYVLANPQRFPYLTAIEDPQATPTWFHFDVRLHFKQGVWIVRP